VKEGGQEMEHEPRNVVLSGHRAELLCAVHNRHPEMSTFAREMESAAPRIRAKPGATFSRQNIAEFGNVATRPLGRNGFGLRETGAERETRVIEKGMALPADAHPEFP
jgi:hypothetical protein